MFSRGRLALAHQEQQQRLPLLLGQGVQLGGAGRQTLRAQRERECEKSDTEGVPTSKADGQEPRAWRLSGSAGVGCGDTSYSASRRCARREGCRLKACSLPAAPPPALCAEGSNTRSERSLRSAPSCCATTSSRTQARSSAARKGRDVRVSRLQSPALRAQPSRTDAQRRVHVQQAQHALLAQRRQRAQ